MSNQNSSFSKFLVAILISTFFLAILIPFFKLPVISVFLLILMIYSIIISLFFIKTGFFLLIILRPCLDFFSKEPLLILNGTPFNFASLLGFYIIFFTLYIAFFKKEEKLTAMPLKKPILLFLSITFVFSFISISIQSGIIEWLRLVSIFSVFTLAFLLTDSRKDLNNFINTIIASAIIPSFFALYQFFSKTGLSIPNEGIYNRIFGTFIHPNLLAYFLVIPISLALLKFISGKKTKLENNLALFLFLFFSSVLLLTFTRGAWLALAGSLLIVAILRYVYLLPFVLASMLLIYLTVIPIQNRINGLFDFSSQSSVGWRIELWQDASQIAKEKPLYGVGTGAAEIAILDQRGKEMGSPSPHNDYLKILIENGIIGLISYFLLIFSILLQLNKKYKKIQKSKYKTLVLAMLAFTVIFYTISFADNIIRNTALQWTYWLLLGGILAIKIKKPRNS